MVVDKNTLRKWLRTKLKPTQQQFWAWIDSYWHKDEQIPVANIKGLDDLLGNAVTVESLTALTERVQVLENAPRKGVQSDETISLMADVLQKYTLPENAMLLAIEVQGVATVQVSNSESELGNLGEVESAGTAVLQFGFLDVDSIYLQADGAVDVTPIIYVK